MLLQSYKSNQELLRYTYFKSATALDQFFGWWLNMKESQLSALHICDCDTFVIKIKIDHMIMKNCKTDQSNVETCRFRLSWNTETVFVRVYSTEWTWWECTLAGVYQMGHVVCVSLFGEQIYDWSIIRMSHVLGKAGGNIKMTVLDCCISTSSNWSSRWVVIVLCGNSNMLRKGVLTEVLELQLISLRNQLGYPIKYA